MGALIETQNISKTFIDSRAVNRFSIKVAAGEIYGLVGPDGAGKTTTIRLLCGAYRPDPTSDGETVDIQIGGCDVLRNTEEARAQIGYLPQRFSLYEEMTVLENLRFFAEVRGLKSSEWYPRCLDILKFVGLDPYIDRRAGFLSGGMKQKLGLAAALVHNPKVLLLDEPTTGVDPVTRQDFWQLVIRLVTRNSEADQETAVLISTPYMDEASRCTRVGFMLRGKLVEEGTPSHLRNRLEGRIIELAGSPISKLRCLAMEDDEVEDVQMFGDRLHILVESGKSDSVISRLSKRLPAEGGQIKILRGIPPLLEDVFIGFVKDLE